MSDSGLAKAVEQLGMSHGTASHILRRRLFFELVKETGRDRCFKCGNPIENDTDLSIEHKLPWLDVSADLFWDLSNIAYSHRKCNTPDRPRRKIGPEGTSWCARCKRYLPERLFSKNVRRWNGLHSYCSPCDIEKQRRYDQKQPRYKCKQCGTWMRKKCRGCGLELTMAQYMALRRVEGATY